jgi:hypothetical protein
MLGYEKQTLRFQTRGGWKTVALDRGEGYQNCEVCDGVLRSEGGVTPFLIGGETVRVDHNLPMPIQFFRVPNANGEAGFGYLADFGYFFLFDESTREFVCKHIFYAQRFLAKLTHRRRKRDKPVLLLIYLYIIYKFLVIIRKHNLFCHNLFS